MSTERTEFTLGQMLAHARMAAELNSEQVAQKLNLTMHLIEKIEGDQFDRTGLAPIFLCGHIRAYAKLVGIEQPIVEQHLVVIGLLQKSNGTADTPTNAPPTYPATPLLSHRTRKIGSYIVVVVILIGIALVWHNHRKPTLIPEAKTTTIVQTPPQTTPQTQHKEAPVVEASTNATILAALPEPGPTDSTAGANGHNS